MIKTKLGYVALLFFIYLVNREIYCPFFGFACGEELAALLPYVIIFTYFGIVCLMLIFSELLFVRTSDKYDKRIVQTDYAIEIIFYATTILLLLSERNYPNLILRVFIFFAVDLVFMFYIFRKGFSIKQDEDDNHNVQGPFKTYLIITILSLIGFLLIISFIPWLYRSFILGMH